MLNLKRPHAPKKHPALKKETAWSHRKEVGQKTDGGTPLVCPGCLRDLDDSQPIQETLQCASCGTTRYTDPMLMAIDRQPLRRLGDPKKPGRDFALAVMGAEFLRRGGLSLLWWSPGCSADYARIKRIPLVSSLAVWGSENLCKCQDEPVSSPKFRSADVIIANDVIDYILDETPWEVAFAALRDESVLICSTSFCANEAAACEVNARIGWTYKGLNTLAARHGVMLDIRVPEATKMLARERERYAIFSRSPRVIRNVRTFFGRCYLAPGEDL